MALVSVCVCTYRRAHVAETIKSLLSQRLSAEDTFEIVVIDDDRARSAEAIVASFQDAPVLVRYAHFGAGNVSLARNVALDAATGDWIAFIDDDELAAPDWLASLLRVQRESGADIVKGYVDGIYPPETPAWVRAGDPYTRDYGADGETPRLLASGNVLFRRALIESIKLRFDPAFGRTGGEDSDFFGRLREAGARAVASRSAVVQEIVPADRVTVAYLRRRSRRMGQTDGRKAKTAGRALAAGLGAAIAAGGSVIYPLALLLSGRVGFKVFAKFWYSVGMLEGLAGWAKEEM